jgi:hypothetical protein
VLLCEVDLLWSHIHLPLFVLAQGVQLQNLNQILAGSFLYIKCVYHFWLAHKQLDAGVEIVEHLIDKFLKDALLLILQGYFYNIVQLVENDLVDFKQ